VTIDSPAEFERVAREAAEAAGESLRERFQHEMPLAVETKGLHDFVTEADHQAEAIVISHLQRHCPDHTILSEESFPETGPGGYRWIVDPLDGTTNFIHGVPTFCVSIALEDHSGLLAAAIRDPMRGETFHAHRGGGARCNGKPIRCTDPEEPTDALIATGFPFREMSRVKPYLVAFERFIHSTAGLRRAGSAAMDLAYTACGRYDGFWEVGLSTWDIAAGSLLVIEAGGQVTDVLGNDGYLRSGDIVAAGRKLHPIMLETTREAFGT
jgi:myo-inositol-1(or 4)-monophosphatase